MGKGRQAEARRRMPRLTRRVLVGAVAASAALGGGTAGALMSIGGTPTHPAPATASHSHALSQTPVRVDPGGPIIVAPDPGPPSTPAPPASPASAPIPSTPPTPPPPPPPPIGAAALSQISYPWQQLGYQIVFLGPRPDLMGQTIFDQHRIEIYLRDGESKLMVAHVIAHEIGHAADVAYNTPERRKQWLHLRGASTSQPWFGCEGCDDFSSPAGDYAETFSFWQVGPDADYSQLAPPPSPDQLRQLVPLFFASSSGSSGSSAGPPPSSPSSPPSSGGSGPPPSSNPPPGQSCLTVVCASRG
jgi:hypothetical protein